MSKLYTCSLTLFFVLAALVAGAQCSADPWINELHYDNAGADVNEFVEVAGPAGLDLSGYELVLYNGSNGTTYDTQVLSGILDDEGAGGGALSFGFPSIQNGGPDGVALVETATNAVIQFLSYEGSFTASNGPAAGQTSTDIGVSENGGTAAGESLQLVGSGCAPGDFTWTGPAADSPGDLNAGQTYAVPGPGNQPPSAGPARVGVQLPTQGGADCPSAVTVLDPTGATLMAGATLAVDDVLTIAGIGVPVPTAAEVSDDNDPPGSLIVNVTDLTVTPAACTTEVSITYTVEDTQGAVSTPRTDVVLVIDNTPPVLTAPGPVTLSCAQFDAAASTGTPTVSDCDPMPTVTFLDGPITPPGAPLCNTATFVRTFTATDACGSSATATQVVSVEIPPVGPTLPADVQLTCDDDATDLTVTGEPTPSGSCSLGDGLVFTGAFTDVQVAAACPAVLVLERTFTVTDPCGNLSSLGPQTITVVDNTAPVVVAPADVSRDCSQSTDPASTGTATATDDCAPGMAPLIASGQVFINEFHYDNAGGDSGEGVEVAGPAGTDLSAYTLQPYNGSNGTPYAATALSGVIPDEGAGYGAVFFPISGLQNGAPDGIALCGPTGVIEFLSYEGTLTAVGGCADGVTSTDVGVSENGGTAAGESLQRTGTGTTAGDFTWTGPTLASYGVLNAGQTIQMPGGGGGGGGGGTPGTGGPVPTSFTDVIVPGSCPDDFVIERTFTATDVCGNTATAVQTITVTDDQAPAINSAAGSLDLAVTQADVAAFSTGTCADELDLVALAQDVADDLNALMASPFLAALPVAGDNCSLDDFAVAASFAPGSNSCTALVDLSLTVADACGNVSDPFVATLTVTGTGAATLPQSPSATLMTSAGASCLDPFAGLTAGTQFAPGASVTLAGVPVALPGLTDIMGCVGANPTFTLASFASSVGADPCVTALSLDFAFANDCGAAATQPFTLTAELVDDTAPVVVAPPTAMLSCEQDATDLALTGNATATDNCAPVTNAPLVTTGPVFINEFHYDNPGGDVNEFVEIAGPAGTDLAGYTIELVNGNNQSVYNTLTLSGILPDQGMGYGALAFTYPPNGLQNGSPDGIALCGPAGVIEFLSYEGAFTADATNGGCAAGMMSTDVGVEETNQSGSAIGSSLQRVGSGLNGADFAFVGPAPESPGSINANQSFNTAGPPSGGSVATTFADVVVPGSCAGEFTIERTFTATDACGNVGSAVQIITVTDDDAPMFAQAPGSLDNAVTTSQLAAAGLGNCAVSLDLAALRLDVSFALLFGQTDFNGLFDFPTATDVCSQTSLSLSTIAPGAIAGAAPCSAELVFTFTAVDACGNQADFPIALTITDDEAPVLRPGLVTAFTIECDQPRDTSVTGTPVFDDNCGNSLPPVASVWINEFHYDNAGGDVNEFVEVAGGAGLDLAGYTLVLYNGNTGGTYNTVALAGVLPDEGAGGGAIDFQLPSNGLQNGSPDGIALVDAAGAVVEFLSYEGDFTAVGGPADGVTSMDVGVAETGATLSTESLQRIGAGSTGDAFVFAGPRAASPGALNTGQVYLSSQTVTIGFSESSVPDPSCPNGEVITRTFTADDGCGNTASFVQTITVVDTQAPEYTLFQADTTIECSSVIGGADSLTVAVIADNLPFPLVEDNCADNLSPTFTDAYDASADCPTVGTFTRAFDAIDDGCGNVLPARTLTITIVDTLAPVLSNLPVAGDYDCSVGLPDVANVTAEDCDANLVFTVSEVDDDDDSLGLGLPGEGGVVRVVTQSFTATDQCGQSSAASVVLRLLDTEAPVLVSCPSDIGPLVARPDDRAAVDYPLPVFTDNCAFTVTNSNPPGSDFPVGLTTVEVVATDEGGNRAVCSFTVEVVKALNIACTTNEISIDDAGDQTRADINFPYAETDCDLCPQGEPLPGLEYLGYFRGHRYYVSAPGVELAPEAANDFAIGLGGRLVQLDSPEENRFVQRELPYDEALIGLWSFGGQDHWRWTTDDNATDYRNWRGGTAPSGAGAEQYAAIGASDGEHFAVGASELPFVVEFSCINFEVLDDSPTGTFGQGTGCILYAAEDQCGNRDTCHYTFRVTTFDVNYCLPQPITFGEQISEEYGITAVRIGAFAKTFDIGDDYYNLRDTVEVSEDTQTSVSLQAATTGPDGASFPSYWRVWVDANRDGDFYDAGELLYEDTGDAGTVGRFTLPSALGAVTPTRVRVAVSRGDFPEPCGANPFGDFKDFTLVSDGQAAQPRLTLAGRARGGVPQLTTSSLEEPQIARYFLLRGETADDLTKLDQWLATARDGDRHSYDYDDTDPLIAAFYQAVALDADGHLVRRSNVVYLELPVRKIPVRLFPNPAKDRVVVVTPEPVGPVAGEVQLFDALGRAVYRTAWPAEAEQLELLLPTLPTGAYQLRVVHPAVEPTPLRVLIDQSGTATPPRA